VRGSKTWPTGIWPLMVQVPNEVDGNFYFGNTTIGTFSLEVTIQNLRLIMKNLSLNALQYIGALSSPQLIPFYNYVLIGTIFVSKIKISPHTYPIFIPLLLPIFYFAYGGPFSVERYLTLLIFPVGLLASISGHSLKLRNLRVSLIFIALLFNLMFSAVGLLFGNQTYA
jgi:hypothetical protein